jgi:hypothetical protein
MHFERTYEYFPSDFFAILHTSLAFMSIYCKHKYITAKLESQQMAHWTLFQTKVVKVNELCILTYVLIFSTTMRLEKIGKFDLSRMYRWARDYWSYLNSPDNSQYIHPIPSFIKLHRVISKMKDANGWIDTASHYILHEKKVYKLHTKHVPSTKTHFLGFSVA